MQTLIRRVALLLLTVSLAACNTAPEKRPFRPQAQSMNTNPETLLAQARFAINPTQRNLYYLEAAKLYWENSLASQSSAALTAIDPVHLPPSELQNYQLMRLQLALYLEDLTTVSQTLPLLNPNQFEQTSIEHQIELSNLYAAGLAAIDKPIRSAITLIENQGLLDEESISNSNEQIWNLLRAADTSSLTQFQYYGTNDDVHAWLELARILKLNQTELEQQYNALMNWQSRWPDHPATKHLPSELTLLSNLPETSPDQITLALPLSGPLENVGKAIRDGFIANYYDSKSNQKDLEINFYDTHIKSIENLYEKPSNNKSLIVGPLDKKSIKTIAAYDSLPIRTLALNTLNDSTHRNANLYQFGLAPDTESKQVAAHMAKKGYQKIAIIAPEADWGIRTHDAFVAEALLHNTAVIESVFYSDQASLSSTVARLLATDQSHQRARTVQNIIGRNVETSPRRRQDVDAIFMAAKPDIAKQLKPLFAYHYAGNLPVYSTSQIHGDLDTSERRDLDGIRFVEMPWMLSNTNNLKNMISRFAPERQQRYSRFFALGADAYDLAPRLELLHHVKNSQLEGQTGTLSISDQGKIERHLHWAEFDKGRTITIQE